MPDSKLHGKKVLYSKKWQAFSNVVFNQKCMELQQIYLRVPLRKAIFLTGDEKVIRPPFFLQLSAQRSRSIFGGRGEYYQLFLNLFRE
jgi:hypothetical protein